MVAAAALGAVVVEKHITLDRMPPGPDQQASLEPEEFAALVAGIRTVERALGTGEKIPSARERSNIPAARRSLVSARGIAKMPSSPPRISRSCDRERACHRQRWMRLSGGKPAARSPRDGTDGRHAFMRKIAVVTGTRADFGIYLPVLRAIGDEPDLKAEILVCGTHLIPDYGDTASEIEDAGFAIARKIDTFAGATSPALVCRSMAMSATGFSQAFADDRPDIVLVLGDRYEMFSAAGSALVHGLPLAHIHGGELSEGANDDAFRHAITKMSHLHFVSTEDHGRRVRQLGEAAGRVHVTGAPGLDTLSDDEIADRNELEEFLKLPFESSPIVATYHPVTLEPCQSVAQIGEMLAVLENADRPVVITYPNADAEAGHIILEIRNSRKATAMPLRLQALARGGIAG